MIELIDSVLDILRQNRSNCEIVFHKIFDQAKNECEKRDAPLQARSHGRGDSGAVPPQNFLFPENFVFKNIIKTTIVPL